MASRPPRKCSIVGDGMVTLGVRLRHRLEELEIRQLDRLDVAHRAGYVHHRRREIDVAGSAVEGDRDAALRFDALELLEEVDMEIGAPEFAVGDALQSEILLETNDVADRRILDLAQRGGRDLALFAPSRAHRATPADAGNCRRDRRETAVGYERTSLCLLARGGLMSRIGGLPPRALKRLSCRGTRALGMRARMHRSRTNGRTHDFAQQRPDHSQGGLA